MATRSIVLQAGINFETTPSGNPTQYQDSNLIRFAPSGLPEKIGGFTKFFPDPIGSIVRELHAWETLAGDDALAVGAEAELGVIIDGTLSDITPQRTETNSPVNVSTTAGSPTVIIIDTGLQPGVGDVVIINTQISVGGIVISGGYNIAPLSVNKYSITATSNATSTVANAGTVPIFNTSAGNSLVVVDFPDNGLSVGSSFAVLVPSSVGGITLSGFYTVISVESSAQFSISAASAAVSNDQQFMNAGEAQYVYYFSNSNILPGGGYGIGGYGRGPYGIGTTWTPSGGFPITTTDWSLDNFGGDLIAVPLNGPIFIWIPQSGTPIATPIAQAPPINTGAFVAMPQQIIVAYGSSVLGVQDPLLITWSDAGQFTVWTAAVTNQAGSFRISRGSVIVGGMQGPLVGLIWTDLSMWTMSYIGQPLIWSFNELASGCGLIGKHAAVTLGTTVYWMSQTQFFSLPAGGSVTPLSCPVWDFIFQNLDASNVTKIRAAANSRFGEVAWYFPVFDGSGENTAYVKFCPAFNAWDVGYLGRTAWIDQSVFGPPIGAGLRGAYGLGPYGAGGYGVGSGNNFIYQHETSPDADGEPLLASITTGYFALEDGQDMATVNMLYPDMKWNLASGANTPATVNHVFTYTKYATGSPVYTTPTYTASSDGPPFLNVRFRGRLASITISSDDLGSWWRWGNPRLRTAPDGRL